MSHKLPRKEKLEHLPIQKLDDLSHLLLAKRKTKAQGEQHQPASEYVDPETFENLPSWAQTRLGSEGIDPNTFARLPSWAQDKLRGDGSTAERRALEQRRMGRRKVRLLAERSVERLSPETTTADIERQIDILQLGRPTRKVNLKRTR